MGHRFWHKNNLSKLIKFNHNGLHTKNSKELVPIFLYAFRYIPEATGHNLVGFWRECTHKQRTTWVSLNKINNTQLDHLSLPKQNNQINSGTTRGSLNKINKTQLDHLSLPNKIDNTQWDPLSLPKHKRQDTMEPPESL